jgi:6,7-dimethyl-8-ribityllumazine synthase
MKKIEGNLTAKGLKIGIVVSRFNSFITESLLSGALDCLKRHETDEKDIVVVWAPGSFEIPLVAKKMAQGKKFDAIIALGAIIRGQTPHFEYVSAETTKGIAQVSLDSTIPIGYGIITADTIEQAIERAGTKAGNKGWSAALTVIEMANLIKNI